LTPASRRQNHTISPSAPALFVSSTSASIASRPAFVTIASRPSWWDETAGLVEVIWVGAERNYFCNRDWTPQITLIRFNKSVFCENAPPVKAQLFTTTA
jgi:hypothetical protein